MDSREIIRKSDVVFVKIGGLEIYKLHYRSKSDVQRAGSNQKYFSTKEVINVLNDDKLRVSIVDYDNCLLEKNF